MADLFWSNVNTDPKRRFRFTVGIGNIPVWTIKTAAKPRAAVSVVEHQFINHTFKYPGRVTWENIQITLVDPVTPDLAKTFIDKLRGSGYDYPTTSNVRGSLSKKRSVESLGSIRLSQIDSDGNPIVVWDLHSPFLTSIDFGGNLDYTADEMNEITVEIAYDWAELVTFGNAVPSLITPR